jgi:ribosomal protein S18 acetylase RimI-like enzyme
MAHDPALALRTEADDDIPFLVGLYGSTREEELDQVPWLPGAKEEFVRSQFDLQRAHYRNHYPGAAFDLILVDGRPGGRLYVHRGDAGIRIMDIALTPEFRGRGIGTHYLRLLQQESTTTGKTLSIHVEIHNPAKRLYERLGFRVSGSHGDIYLRMDYRQATPAT